MPIFFYHFTEEKQAAEKYDSQVQETALTEACDTGKEIQTLGE